MQAALGASQIDKLPAFIERRKHNFRRLSAALEPLSEYLLLPEATPGADPSWFGFLIGVREDAPFTRAAAHRRAGSQEDRHAPALRRQPAAPACLRGPCTTAPSATCANTDYVMNNVFWIGVFPGLTDEMLDFISKTILDFVANPNAGANAEELVGIANATVNQERLK